MSTALYSELQSPRSAPSNTTSELYAGGVATGGSLLWVVDAERRATALAQAADLDPKDVVSVDPTCITYSAGAVNKLFEMDYDSYSDRAECLYFAPFNLFIAGAVIGAILDKRNHLVHVADGYIDGFLDTRNQIIHAGGNVVSRILDVGDNIAGLSGLVLPGASSKSLTAASFGMGELTMGSQPFRALVAPDPPVQTRTREVPQRDIQELTAAIEAALPELSQTVIARMFGVTRQGWRDWRSGSSMPRSKKRRRIYGFQRILDLRRTVAPGQSAGLWLEAPISVRDSRTPADLLAAGRDDLVAALAASVIAAPATDEFEVQEIDLGVQTNDEEAEKALQIAREITFGDSAEKG